jgi:hypothetical protein
MQDNTTNRKLSMEKDPNIVKDSNGVPSGFVLKLYQMVNGAPDEIISVRLEQSSLVILYTGAQREFLITKMNVAYYCAGISFQAFSL